MVRITAPSGGVSRTKSTAAAAKAATPDFMSVAPRPYRNPSFSSAPKGSTVQAALSPTGTTSVWPLKPNVRAWPFAPQRANRFDVSPLSTRVQSNPASRSNRSNRTSAPPSTGVTEGQRISAAVSAAGSVTVIGAPCLHVSYSTDLARNCLWVQSIPARQLDPLRGFVVAFFPFESTAGRGSLPCGRQAPREID